MYYEEDDEEQEVKSNLINRDARQYFSGASKVSQTTEPFDSSSSPGHAATTGQYGWPSLSYRPQLGNMRKPNSTLSCKTDI